MIELVESQRIALLSAAKEAMGKAYAPYSNFPVGAALLFDDGAIVAASNVENASYGLSFCAESLAVAKAMNEARRTGLIAVALVGLGEGQISPCGRCRQVLSELAQLSGSDPLVLSGTGAGAMEQIGTGQLPALKQWYLSQLLPDAFGPDQL